LAQVLTTKRVGSRKILALCSCFVYKNKNRTKNRRQEGNMDAMMYQMLGWLAVAMIWTFLPFAAWRTWQDYRQRRSAKPRVQMISRSVAGLPVRA
jgi:hypothetical protein